VGLLLLLGLFWFWASSLIGDDGDAPATPSTQAIILTPDVPTPTQTVEAEINPVETTETDQGTGEGEVTVEPTPTTEEESQSTGGTYEVDDLVAVTENSVNLRSEPTTDSEAVEQMSAGDELVITGGPENDGEFDWWPVLDEVNDLSGWIREDFLEPSN
jgi:hypothetical protein